MTTAMYIAVAIMTVGALACAVVLWKICKGEKNV